MPNQVCESPVPLVEWKMRREADGRTRSIEAEQGGERQARRRGELIEFGLGSFSIIYIVDIFIHYWMAEGLAWSYND